MSTLRLAVRPAGLVGPRLRAVVAPRCSSEKVQRDLKANVPLADEQGQQAALARQLGKGGPGGERVRSKHVQKRVGGDLQPEKQASALQRQTVPKAKRGKSRSQKVQAAVPAAAPPDQERAAAALQRQVNGASAGAPAAAPAAPKKAAPAAEDAPKAAAPAAPKAAASAPKTPFAPCASFEDGSLLFTADALGKVSYSDMLQGQ